MSYKGISNYYQSFSGTDTMAFILMPDAAPVVIGSLTTISYSMYRNKKPVVNIGRTNINGVTRGSRIYAGTMVFTLINQHWLKELQEKVEYLKNVQDLKVDELPLFDIMIISANEYGSAVSMYIYGIDFTDEAQVVSVEDLFTENTFSFIARDVSTFKKINVYEKISGSGTSVEKPFVVEEMGQKFFVIDSSNLSLDDTDVLEKRFEESEIINTIQKDKIFSLPRVLYYSTSKLIIGNDVSEIQHLLNKTKLFDVIDENGIFDKKTEDLVKLFQSLEGLEINGVVDEKLYNILKYYDYSSTQVEKLFGIVVNKNGTYVYKNADILSDIVDIKEYKEQIEILSIEEYKEQKYYKINTGYIIQEDIYSANLTGEGIEFPIIKYEDETVYVTVIQNALQIIYKDLEITGIYDDETQEIVKQIQEENGMDPNGIVDKSTWLLIQSLTGNINNQLSDDNFTMEFNLPMDTYNLTKEHLFEHLKNFNVLASCGRYINIKRSCVSYYPNGNTKMFSKVAKIKEEQELSLMDFSKAFNYNPTEGSIPNRVEYIIYPYGKKPCKWTINYV